MKKSFVCFTSVYKRRLLCYYNTIFPVNIQIFYIYVECIFFVLFCFFVYSTVTSGRGKGTRRFFFRIIFSFSFPPPPSTAPQRVNQTRETILSPRVPGRASKRRIKNIYRVPRVYRLMYAFPALHHPPLTISFYSNLLRLRLYRSIFYYYRERTGPRALSAYSI